MEHVGYLADTDDSPRPVPGATPRLQYERLGMVLHAALNAMNHSRNTFASGVLRDLITEHPTLAKAHAFLGSATGRMGDAEGAIAHHERAVELDPSDVSLHSTLIFALDQAPSVTLERAFAARRAFNALVRVPETAPHPNDRDPERPLRIGYCSADFRNHSAAYGWAPVLLAHTRGAFELYAYSCSELIDERTADFQAAVEHWHDASSWSDDRLETQIRADQIDILVDLSGHSAGNRLKVFARKPAPIQITGWGYITGTGLDAMDYLFADDVCIRPEEERYYAERILKLPRILTCWAPGGIPVAPLPAEQHGHLTFGVFNRLGKIQPRCAEAWGQILQQLPTARLVFKCPGLDDEAARLSLEGMLHRAGVPLDRLEFRGMTNQDEHIKAYGLIDVALDPSPHGGGMSTLDAAWMGVPTLTLPDKQIPSRIATTINRELGLGYLIADSWDDYVERAVALDTQRTELARVRALLHDMMTVSSFGDHLGYARAVEAQYRAVWREWCAEPVAAPAPPPVLHVVPDRRWDADENRWEMGHD